MSLPSKLNYAHGLLLNVISRSKITPVVYFSSISRKNKVEGGKSRSKEDDNEAASRDVAGLAKAGIAGAVDAGLKLGEIAKRTVDGVWDATKTTAEGVRDSVSDDHRCEDDNEEHIRDLRRRTRDCTYKD